jgi:hypothetical protein
VAGYNSGRVNTGDDVVAAGYQSGYLNPHDNVVLLGRSASATGPGQMSFSNGTYQFRTDTVNLTGDVYAKVTNGSGELPIVISDGTTPTNTTTPVSWRKIIMQAGTFWIPLYQ